MQLTGKITYNGVEFPEFNVRRTASYVHQRDSHTPSLTVRETFDFSAACQGAWLDQRGEWLAGGVVRVYDVPLCSVLRFLCAGLFCFLWTSGQVFWFSFLFPALLPTTELLMN